MLAFWIRADVDDAEFRGDEIRAFPPATREVLEKESLLKRGEDLRMAECVDCGDPHIEEVDIITDSPDGAPRAYILCERAGCRAAVSVDRLQVWAIDFDRLANVVSSALELAGRIVQVVADRVWLLGTAKLADRTRDIFLMRGITWPDNLALLAGNTRLSASPCPLILCMNRVPNDAEWRDHERVVMSLSEFDWLQGSRAELKTRITDVLREHPKSPHYTEVPTQGKNKVARSIGSAAAVNALLALKDRKGWTVEQLSIEVGTTARTLQSFFKTSKVRNSVFRTISERLSTSPEDLLKGHFPDRRD